MNNPQSKESRNSDFINLLVPNQRRIQAFIIMLVPNLNDAEDILQETLTEMWNKFDSYTPGTDFPAWAITIARYKVLSFRKRNYNNKLMFSDKIFDILDSAAQQSNKTLSNHIDTLKSCLTKLSEQESFLLNLRYEHELSFRKMSSRVGKSSVSIHRSMKIILSKLSLCVRHNLRLEESL